MGILKCTDMTLRKWVGSRQGSDIEEAMWRIAPDRYIGGAHWGE